MNELGPMIADAVGTQILRVIAVAAIAALGVGLFAGWWLL
jgi:hypothetical protein